MYIRTPLIALVAATLVAPGLAQQVRAIAPVGAIGPGPESDEDAGIPVKMFENHNLDRYLRRAQTFLEEANYVAAIEVLQAVIQGRTVEFLGSSDEHPPSGDAIGEAPAAAEVKPTGDGEPTEKRTAVELDAANSVFSQDGRLYRPVRRLCHELLSRMPPAGVELYRTLYEVEARQLFDAALASGSIPELEQVVNRFFVTQPAGQAMVVLADRFMFEGRFRAAVQVLRDLVEVYPAANLGRIGVDPIWCKFKIALCLKMAGEPAVAHETVQRIAAEHPEDSLRILGELQTIKRLPELPIFADEVIAMIEDAVVATGPSWLGTGNEDLVPLWQYRFVDQQPYRNPKSSKQNDNGFIVWNGGTAMTAMPHANRYGPASWIRFVPGEAPGQSPRALFFDHFRLRVADARTGLLVRDGDGAEAPPQPREGHPRVRIAAHDHALLRPVEDEDRRYAVLGHERTTSQSVETLKSSELVAYDRQTMARLWSSTQWLDGTDGLRDVTFLAAPTVFGERLLLPALRRDAYALECLDRKTGRPLWHAMLHSGGSPFFKAPGSPVLVSGGTAFVVTNAGCLAAVDAFAGDLRWIRRYEREDPLRPKVRPNNPNSEEQRYGIQFVQSDLATFLPNDLVLVNGLVILAACDSGMLLCVDGATGEPVWMLDGTTRYARYGTLRTIVGATATDLFLTSDDELICVALRGGLVKWMRELPPLSGPKNVGRGRGEVVGDHVLVPGENEICVFDTKGIEPMRRLRLPSFGVGEEPLQLPFNITSVGPWLGIGYGGGVEVFSSKAALRELADKAGDLWQAAGFQISAGDLRAAEKSLVAWLADGALTDEQRLAGARRLLSLVRERSLQLVHNGHLSEALAAFEEISSLCAARSVRMGWHLARVEACQLAGDLRAYENEQQRLYDFMEGKG